MIPQHKRLIPALSACAIFIFAWMYPAFAENIIFPHVKSGITDVSGFIDVTLPPYSADKTGKTDVTAILQQACSDNKKWTTIYLPNGTYLVSNTIRISEVCVTGGSGGFNCGVEAPIMQGQSRSGTVIRLAPGTFTSAAAPKPVLFSGDGVAQIFRRGIHNLTVSVGANNAGANGIRWFSNNTGLMSDVAAISEDGSANIGVDLTGGEEGPCAMRDIYVKGFAYGCRSNALNSVTVLNLTVENARVCGVLNENNPLYIDNLTCVNADLGVRNTGYLTLINAQLTGGNATKPAVDNAALLFARNIRAQGYQKALATSGRAASSGLTIDEYATNQVSQFPSPTHSMNLPNKPIPDVPWEQDTTKWGNVWANIGGLGGNRKTDSASFQSLIDNPAITSICVPFGKAFQINGDILIRGNIQRIVGTGASLTGAGRLVITSDLTQPVIKLERMTGLQIVNQSNKTVVIESYNGDITSTGSGDLFICDWVGYCTPNNANQRIWAWQFNAEGSCGPTGELCLNGAVAVNIRVNNVRTFRIFGWKDEGNATSIDVINGAVEVLGFMNYPSLPTAGQTEFLIENSGQFSLSCASQISFNNSYYANLVRETRNGVTKTLTSSTSGSGGNLPLYTGYDSAKVQSAVSTQLPECRAIDTHRPGVRVEGRKIVIAGLPQRADIFSIDGARLTTCTVRKVGGFAIIDGIRSGAYVISITNGGQKTTYSAIVP